MINKLQCPDGLLYKGLSVVYIQTFTPHGMKIDTRFVKSEKELFGSNTDSSYDGFMDNELFTHDIDIIRRFRLTGFDAEIKIGGKSPVTVKGTIHVKASVFFDKTVVLTYRLVVPQQPDFCGTFCTADKPYLNTDQMIALAGLIQGVEHWEYDEDKKRQCIEGAVRSVKITDLYLDEDSVVRTTPVQEEVTDIKEVMRRYRNLFCGRKDKPVCRYHDYTMIDVWEDVGHAGEEIVFSEMSEAEIIQHIETHHRGELVGLMSLYPEEWPYRCEDSYEDICGKNIAIDTDDLVLVNPVMSVVVGTYGNRGGEGDGVDWKKHLERRCAYHVSWPEYLVILEIVLAKKEMLNNALNSCIDNLREDPDMENIDKIIDKNAKLNVRLSNMMMRIELMLHLKFMSHKYMFAMAQKHLCIKEEEKSLQEAIARIDASLNNANSMYDIKASDETKNVLWFISVASLFGVLLQNDHVPIIRTVSQSTSVWVAWILVTLTAIGITCGLFIIGKTILKYHHKKKRQQTYND